MSKYIMANLISAFYRQSGDFYGKRSAHVYFRHQALADAANACQPFETIRSGWRPSDRRYARRLSANTLQP